MIKHISSLGANVTGVNRRGRNVDGCSKVITFDKIDKVLPDADFLYLAVPETNETKGMINKKRLDALKHTCGIVNIGRQSVMDYEHLQKKLKKNEISGAILDVFSEEPIKRNSKFWNTPNLVITPHISSDSKGKYIEMVLEKFLTNLKLFIDKKDLVLTNSRGIQAKKAGEFGLMSILMLQNQMTRIITNQKQKDYVTLLSNPIENKHVVVVGTGSLGGSMIKHISSLGANVIGVNRRGRKVDGCSKVIKFDKIDKVLPDADFLYLAVPELSLIHI